MLYHLRALLFLALISINVSFASGPSTIFSKMEPLAINAKGEILCKSFYSKNDHGSRYVTDAEVALCIVKEGEISVLQALDYFKSAPDIADYDRDFKAYEDILNRYSALNFSENDPLLVDFMRGLFNKDLKL